MASIEGIIQAPEIIADASTGAKERESFAMLPPSMQRLQASDTKGRELKPRYRSKIAGKRPPAHRVAMARHLQFGWYGGSFW
jgi:hypothetical protein